MMLEPKLIMGDGSFRGVVLGRGREVIGDVITEESMSSCWRNYCEDRLLGPCWSGAHGRGLQCVHCAGGWAALYRVVLRCVALAASMYGSCVSVEGVCIGDLRNEWRGKQGFMES